MAEDLNLKYKPLSESLDVSGFECGEEPWSLSVAGFLQEDALREQSLGFSKTFVFFQNEDCAGFVTTLASQIRTDRYQVPNARYRQAPAVTIGRLGVAQPFHRMGVATKILDWTLVEAANSNFGVKYLTLHVDQDNDPGRSLYERFGFEDWTDSNMDKRFMVYDIYAD
ncbi:MAG: GNAT family N-acetyltransferase [Dehalococcoidia bacterium]